ncbi:MAG: hypothetical protein WBE13_04850 [Candidatus Acidiferrum sp.]
MWFVFCPQSGGTMEYHRMDTTSGEHKAGTMEFECAADAAAWAVRFMTEVDDNVVKFPDELHVVNLEEGITLVITRKKNELAAP